MRSLGEALRVSGVRGSRMAPVKGKKRPNLVERTVADEYFAPAGSRPGTEVDP
jgi:hypothetical protein